MNCFGSLHYLSDVLWLCHCRIMNWGVFCRICLHLLVMPWQCIIYVGWFSKVMVVWCEWLGLWYVWHGNMVYCRITTGMLYEACTLAGLIMQCDTCLFIIYAMVMLCCLYKTWLVMPWWTHADVACWWTEVNLLLLINARYSKVQDDEGMWLQLVMVCCRIVEYVYCSKAGVRGQLVLLFESFYWSLLPNFDVITHFYSY